jgi:hypothetical protein
MVEINMLTIDKLFHYIGGQGLHKIFDFVGLTKTDNALVSGGIMVAKELTDSVFCWWDLAFGAFGWFTML